MSVTNLSAFDIQGNLISPDLTPDVLAGEVKGQSPEDFGFEKSDKLADEIALAWGDAKVYWSAFKRMLARLPEDDPATSVTREQWVVPLLMSLGYKPVYTAKAEIVDGQTYAISHRAERGENKPPIHVVGCRVRLEERPPTGKPRLSAHALVQEYLNRTEHLWAIATNGLRWRLLRDSSLMTRLTYIEFDLEQILEGENFAEFGLFYRLFHRSRLPEGMDDADECLLEFYHQESLQQGGRVRDRLYEGVLTAVKYLGTGFLQHPDSQKLRAAIEDGTLTEGAFYRQLLMLIYRLLFLMVAEARNLLLATTDLNSARIYREYYSLDRLRLLAERPLMRREGFQDLWQGLRITFLLFDESWRGEALGLSPLNGDLFGSKNLEILQGWSIDNADLLQAIRCLSLYEQRGQLRRVNYGALDVEELGSVYQNLLDFHPQIVGRQGIYEFQLVAGSDRKTTGTYYTPPELVGQLIKSALEPVIENCLNALPRTALPAEKIQALLNLKICDPACGSGHFLLAAARRLGKEVARLETGELQPGPEPIRRAVRQVIQHCIYGVDLNPLAVDLCKVALWIEGFCAKMPLNFLDHRIKCGNSLVGVMDLEVLKEGIPDGAFNAVTGDEKSVAGSLKKTNKKHIDAMKTGQLTLFDIEFEQRQAVYASQAAAVDAVEDSTISGYREKLRRYEVARQDAQWWQDFSACNLWTAAFFMGLTRENLALMPTTEALARLLREAEQLEQRETTQGSLFALGETSKSTPFSVVQIVEAANQLAETHRFFHWPLEFPEVFGGTPSSPTPFSPREKGNQSALPSPSGRGVGGEGKWGFDCVLGNPPWERIKLQEKEFFGARDPEIANAKNKAAREKLIRKLETTNPALAEEWETAQHDSSAQGKFIRESDRFPLTAVGDINTYAVFAETVRKVIGQAGRAGIIVPTGIATDATTSKFFSDLVATSHLQKLAGFKNERFIFTGIEHVVTFCILVMGGKETQFKTSTFSWFAYTMPEANDTRRQFQLESEDFRLLNPNTLTCPVFRTSADAELTKKIYKNVPVLENEATGQNPWGISFMRMFDMSNDSGLFEAEPGENRLPLYEAKMFHQFDHRFSTYENASQAQLNVGILPRPEDEQKADPHYTITPRYWVSKTEVEDRLAEKWNKQWLLGFRDVCRSTDERTAIFSLLPRVAVGHKAPLAFVNQRNILLYCLLIANFNSLVLDFVLRQKIGGTSLSYFILKQLPVIPPDRYSRADIDFIAPRVLELTYTAWDMQPFAQDMGYDGEPFIWNPDRRALLRADLDAYYAHLYGLTRDELRYILDPADVYGPDFPSETFRVLKNNEMKQFGEYRTQRLVLEAWDRLFGGAL
jgi:hypothetical protein